jgi:Uma2 family endonuclease
MTSTTDIALDPEKEYELVDGQPQEKEMGGAKHGGIGTRLSAELWLHVKGRRLGGVYGPDTSFRIGANERLPDVSFIAAERIPPSGEPEGAWPLAPDLAVEILSPNDLAEAVLDKISEYFAAGVRQVWLISPRHRTLTVYDSPRSSHILTHEDELLSEELLPGFRCRLAELFAGPPRA